MKHFKARGFIIRRTNFGEADRLVTLFSRKNGKLTVIAKGVRKVGSKRAPHLEIFNEVNVSLYQGKTFAYVTDIETLTSFSGLRTELAKVAIAYQMCELVDRICQEEQQQEEVYQLLAKGLNYMDSVTEIDADKIETIVERFTKRLLSDTGFIVRDASLNAQEYAEVILEKRLCTHKFLTEISGQTKAKPNN